MASTHPIRRPFRVPLGRLAPVLLISLLLGCSGVSLLTPLHELRSTVFHGVVTRSDGSPIENCYVGISNQDFREIRHVNTDSQGRYRIVLDRDGVRSLWVGQSIDGVYSFIPQTAQVEPGRKDFVLHPGVNLGIEAYAVGGDRLTNSEFRTATHSKVFLTDMNDMPLDGYFGAVAWKDAVEHGSNGWPDLQPALIAAPDRRAKLHVQWELPRVGKLLFVLDNAGEGYHLDAAGARLDLNLNVEIARSSLAALRRTLGSTAPTTELARSAFLLERGEALLSQGGADVQRGVRDLTESVEISLEAHEELLLAKAQQSIEQHRKGDLEITLSGPDGAVLEGARVSYTQTGRDFLLGANPMGYRGSFDKGVAELMQGAGINQSHVTARWGLLEKAPGEFDWSNLQEFQQIESQISTGMQLMGALSLWWSPNPDFRPDYLEDMSFPELRKATYRYAYQLAKTFRGKIEIWEINELNLAGANALDLDIDSRIELAREFAQGVKDANPAAKLLNGSTALPFEFPDSAPLREVLRDEVATDIIGLELYYSGVNTDGDSVVGLDLVSLSRTLDHYADLGKPILVKEFSAPSVQVEGSSWWHRPWDEENQADYVKKVYTLAFGNPLVQGISWSWGVSDADAFIVGGGLLDEHFQPKPAYFALQELHEAWTTRGSQVTDDDGKIAFRGFAGDYTIRVEPQVGDAFETQVRIGEREDVRVALEVPRSTISVASASVRSAE